MKVIYKSKNEDKTFTEVILKAQNGENLRKLLLNNGVYPYNGKAKYINCRGLGSCGTCAVSIEEVNSDVSEINNNADFAITNLSTIEKIRLNFPPHKMENTTDKQLRLACQYEIHSDIIVIKNYGFWGQK